jgi:4-hydroxybenzoate polyprenyltransferase
MNTSYFFRNKLHLSILSALGAGAWSIFFNIPINYWAVITVFLLTFSIYQYNRLTDDVEDSANTPENFQDAKKNSFLITYISFYFFSALALLIAYFYGPVAFWTTLIIEIIGFLYNQKCFPEFISKRLGGARRFKDMYVIKNLVPPIDWAAAMVFIPIFFAGESLTLKAWICWGYVFICAFFIEVMWDMRDRRGDLVSGIKTIANTFTFSHTKMLLNTLSVLSGIGLFISTYLNILPDSSYFLLTNNIAVMIIANSYREGHNQQMKTISDMTIVLAGVLFVSFGFIAYFSN